MSRITGVIQKTDGTCGIGSNCSGMGWRSSRKDNFIPDKLSGKLRPPRWWGANVFKVIDSGCCFVTNNTDALFADGGRHKYRLRNFVHIASRACNAELETREVQRQSPYLKSGSMYTANTFKVSWSGTWIKPCVMERFLSCVKHFLHKVKWHVHVQITII